MAPRRNAPDRFECHTCGHRTNNWTAAERHARTERHARVTAIMTTPMDTTKPQATTATLTA